MLNGARIAERRLALALSQPKLARSLGVSPPVIERLEQGESDADQPLGFLQRLADALGVQPSYLLTTTTAPPSTSGPDDVKLEAALETLSRSTPVSVIADGLGWSTERTRGAVRRLQKRLAGTGRVVRYSAGRVGLVPAIDQLSDEEIRALERASVADARVSVADAKTLWEVSLGHASARWLSEASDTRRNSVARLTRLGWIERADKGYVLSADAQWNMELRDTSRDAA